MTPLSKPLALALYVLALLAQVFALTTPTVSTNITGPQSLISPPKTNNLSPLTILTASGHSLSIPKRGLPYHNPPIYIVNFAAPNSQISWAYDWSSKMDPNFPLYLEYVPMLWSAADSLTGKWNTKVKNAIRRGTKDVMAFNEPDGCGPGQACMTPQVAADAWIKWMQPLAGKVRLGGPACTEGYSGTAWLKEFLALCHKCTIDFIPVHMYSTVNNIGHYQRHIQDIRNVMGLPIWVTEFHASGSQTDQISFLETLMQWMDALDYVKRYAWFMCSPTFKGGSLVGSNAKPSMLGRLYELSRPGHLSGDS